MIDAAEKQFLTARTLLREGNVEASLQELNLLLARQPDFGKGQALLGHLLFRYVRDFVNAEEAFRKAMRQAPTHEELYIDYAECLLQLERFTETVAVLNKAMEVPGIEKDKIFRLFGLFNERQEKWDEAIDYFSKAVLYSFSNENILQYEADIDRCIKKKARV
jgi:Tfp pilus assembly protein PilF